VCHLPKDMAIVLLGDQKEMKVEEEEEELVIASVVIASLQL
jgi:hypothetical protein